MIQDKNEALLYLAFKNDDTKQIEPKILSELINESLIYKVGKGFYCTDSGAQKSMAITYPEKSGVLLYHPTYEQKREAA